VYQKVAFANLKNHDLPHATRLGIYIREGAKMEKCSKTPDLKSGKVPDCKNLFVDGAMSIESTSNQNNSLTNMVLTDRKVKNALSENN